MQGKRKSEEMINPIIKKTNTMFIGLLIGSVIIATFFVLIPIWLAKLAVINPWFSLLMLPIAYFMFLVSNYFLMRNDT